MIQYHVALVQAFTSNHSLSIIYQNEENIYIFSESLNQSNRIFVSNVSDTEEYSSCYSFLEQKPKQSNKQSPPPAPTFCF